MTDPFTDARQQIEGHCLLSRAEYELLGLRPDLELRVNRLGALWRSREHMREALALALLGRGGDATEQQEQFDMADREFWQALTDFYPDQDDDQEHQQ